MPQISTEVWVISGALVVGVLALMTIIDGAYKSAASGKPVAL